MILFNRFLGRAFEALIEDIRWNLSRVLNIHELDAIYNLVGVNGRLAATVLSVGSLRKAF